MASHSSQKDALPASALHLTGYFFYALLLPWIVSLLFYFKQGRKDLWPILAASVFFQAFNSLIQCSLANSSSLLPRLNRSSLPLFTNTAVSLIHSSIVGTSVTGILIWECSRKGLTSVFSHEELFSGIWPGAHFILCLSCGYFAYDQWDMLQKHLYNPGAPSLLVHHAVLLVCFTMALYLKVTINYLILTLGCELHSIFLHLRRVLRMSGHREEQGFLTILEWTSNWLTFFTSRILLHVIITCKLILDVSKFPLGIEWPFAIAGMLGLNILNIILGLDLYKAYRKEKNICKND